jgi:hypothetical protein
MNMITIHIIRSLRVALTLNDVQSGRNIEVRTWCVHKPGASYSARKDAAMKSDRLCGSEARMYACKSLAKASFASQQPRLVALPTQRTCDARLATSAWGVDHSVLYTGKDIGPGTYMVGPRSVFQSAYEPFFVRSRGNSLGLPQRAATSLSVVDLVKK